MRSRGLCRRDARDTVWGIELRLVLPRISPLPLLAALSGVPLAAAPPAAAARPLAFNADVRPILADRCFACHGPDARKREADLRLDTREGLFGERKGHAPVVPSDPGRSELVRRVTSSDPSERMPPPKSGKALSDAEKALLRRWVEEGGTWQGHWAYIPPARPEPPPVERAGFVRNEIDRFILEKLLEQGLEPSAEADRATLVRRLSLDLTGLPPEPERVQAFLDDGSPGAYQDLVEELLASPHHGERMAMWWLDLVRYADSVGYHGDHEQTVWPYRDWVIRAFNERMPFDRFTLEQIAGDLLPEATLSQKVAAAYNRLNMMSAEGGGQDKEYHAKYASDRVRATSGAWLGATLGCCECHDHKYDPFTTRDFYSFAAFFADVAERGIYSGANGDGQWGEMMAVPSREQSVELARLDGEIRRARQILDTPTPALDAEAAAWEASLPRTPWSAIRPRAASSSNGATLKVLDDGSVLAEGKSPDKDVYTVTAEAPIDAVTALRIEALPHDSLPAKGPGRAGNGNFVLTEFRATFRRSGGAKDEPIELVAASASFEQKMYAEKTPGGVFSAAGAIDKDVAGSGHGWAVLEEVGKPQHAVFEVHPEASVPAGAALTFTIEQNHEAGKHTLGRFRLSATVAPRPVRAGPYIPDDLAAALAKARGERTAEETAKVAAHHRSVAASLEPARKELAELEKARADLAAKLPRMPATVSVDPRVVRILPRGNWLNDSGEIVSPAVPAFLPGPRVEGRRATRLDLARWLASRENPLTARVLANRLWKIFFGAGLSRRLDDFGAQGDLPSHARLLDWLAVELVDGGWDIRRIVKLIVMSGAYRQSSLTSPALLERDPYNRLLARQGRFRIDAELVRDGALAASGLLVRKVGGPSTRPYQPPGYWSYLNFPTREWQNDSGEGLYRRGLYTHWQRQYLHPSLLAFDAPSREECTADRARSNTPLQALVLLNDPGFVEAARVFAERILREGGATADARIDRAFRIALSRPPSERESGVLRDLVAKHLDEYRKDGAAAKDVLGAGTRQADASLDSAELAAWTSVARTLLNLHEMITRS